MSAREKHDFTLKEFSTSMARGFFEVGTTLMFGSLITTYIKMRDLLSYVSPNACRFVKKNASNESGATTLISISEKNRTKANNN